MNPNPILSSRSGELHPSELAELERDSATRRVTDPAGRVVGQHLDPLPGSAGERELLARIDERRQEEREQLQETAADRQRRLRRGWRRAPLRRHLTG